MGLMRGVCFAVLLTLPLVLSVPLEQSQGIHRKWRTSAQETEAKFLEGAIRQKLKTTDSKTPEHSKDTKEQPNADEPMWKKVLEKGKEYATTGAAYVKEFWNEAKNSDAADFLMKAYQGEPSAAATPSSKNVLTTKPMDLEMATEEASIPVNTTSKPSRKRSKKFVFGDLEDVDSIDSDVPTFRKYGCADDKGEERCKDSCYSKIVDNIMDAPFTADSLTANWVLCTFINAGTGEQCSGQLPESSNSGYTQGRIFSNEGIEHSTIASMEQWVETLQDNCRLRPLVSKVSIAVANSFFDFVVETRQDCKSRIYMASPSGMYGLRTWLREPEQRITPLDIYPYSERILSAARSGVQSTLSTEIANAKESFKGIDSKVLEAIKEARKNYGGGAPLSKEKFATYIGTLRDIFVTYCDSLHNMPRNFWRSFSRFSECITEGVRKKPRAQHFFTEIFGENLDKCSPSFCSFSFDTFAYDETACQYDLQKNRLLKAARNLQKIPDNRPKISLKWNITEDSPAAEDEDPTEAKFQEVDSALPLQHWVMSSIYLAKKAMQHMSQRFASGNTQPKKFDIATFEDMQFQKQDILSRKQQAEEVRKFEKASMEAKTAAVNPESAETSGKAVGPEAKDAEPKITAKLAKTSTSDDDKEVIPLPEGFDSDVELPKEAVLDLNLEEHSKKNHKGAKSSKK